MKNKLRARPLAEGGQLRLVIGRLSKPFVAVVWRHCYITNGIHIYARPKNSPFATGRAL